MSTKKMRIALTAVVTILMMTSSGMCLDSLVVNITDAGFMMDPGNHSDVRAVIGFDLPNTLDSTCWVTVAELRIAATVAQQIDFPLSLRINPVTTAWSQGNVNWVNPWNEPGGDYDDSLTAFGHIRQSGDSDVRIEVTRLIQGFLNGNVANYGLLIRQTEDLMRTFSLRQISIPGGTTVAQIVIYYIQKNT
jgi:hypothetical protein